MLKIEHACLSEQGPVRENNEDYITYHSPGDSVSLINKGHLFVVADGVGGNRAGEVASQQGAEELVKLYYGDSKKADKALREAFTQANLHVYNMGQSKAEYRRMETTLSALVLTNKKIHIGHIGDSRIYRVRSSEVEQLTSDHSEVGELLRMRLINAEEARHHPRRNVITRSLGSELLMKADYQSLPVEEGDIFVLCTDGLWEPLEDAEIAEIVRQNPASIACQKLVSLGIERGTRDNLSLQVIKVLELTIEQVEETVQKNGIIKKAFRFLGS
jgi:protein phosphatase